MLPIDPRSFAIAYRGLLGGYIPAGVWLLILWPANIDILPTAGPAEPNLTLPIDIVD